MKKYILASILLNLAFSAVYADELSELRERAEQGDAEAQFNLGIRYDNGRGVLEDDKEAVKWYRLAAEQGHANAQSNLGFRYANGEGVLEDAIAAYAWLNIARANGHEAASKATDDIQLSQSGIEQAQALSREWVEKIPALLGD